MVPLTEQEGARLFKDVWAARDGYIAVILDRSDENEARFFAQYQSSELNENDRERAIQLMELHATRS